MDDLRDEDVTVDIMRVNSAGRCAVRVTHRPTGTTVTVDDGATTKANHEAALAELRRRLASA